jgi:hypothetical protein
MMKLITNICLVLLLRTSNLVTNAQSISQSSSLTLNGTLSGLILDPVEGRVTRAQIIIEAKGFRRMIKSADDGSYEIALPEGKYKVRVQLDGFYPSRKKSVRIRPNVTTKLDVTLEGIRNDPEHP